MTSTIVTQEQLDKVTRVYDYQAKQYFCLVENSKGEFDADGHKIEYTVRYLHGKGLTCTCKAGQNGHNCWHKRAAVAYVKALRVEQAEQSYLEHLVGQGFSRDEATRIAYANDHPYIPTEQELRQAEMLQAQYNRGFQLMR